MPRPRLRRRVAFEPDVTYFKPAGVRKSDLQQIELTMDELEAVRLKDLLALNQDIAAKKMGVSQPTFHRLVVAARKKIADAIVGGKALKIDGGHYKMSQNVKTCSCIKCGHSIRKRQGAPCKDESCPECGNPMIRGV